MTVTNIKIIFLFIIFIYFHQVVYINEVKLQKHLIYCNQSNNYPIDGNKD